MLPNAIRGKNRDNAGESRPQALALQQGWASPTRTENSDANPFASSSVRRGVAEDAAYGEPQDAQVSVVVRDESVKVTHPDEHPGFWDPLRWAARYEMDALLERRHPRLFRERIESHRVGPLRVRRPIVRACVGVVMALLLAAALVVAGRGPQAVPLLAIAAALELVVWSKWRFHPLRLLPALLVPFAMTIALLRGQARAARIARASAHGPVPK